jgi:hypothetical protein
MANLARQRGGGQHDSGAKEWAARLNDAYALCCLFYYRASTAFQMADALLSLRPNLPSLNCPL